MSKKWLLNIASLNGLRTVVHRLMHKFDDAACVQSFVEQMDIYSKEIGMTKTHWINPSGLGEKGIYSSTTARDLAIMTAHAAQSSQMNEFWSKRSVEIKIKKAFILPLRRYKKKTIYSTLPYEKFEGFRIVGTKTGSGDGYYTLVMATEIGKNVVANALTQCRSDEKRFSAMQELMEIEQSIFDSQAVNLSQVSDADCACAYSVKANGELECLFEQNADFITAPMSTTKVMTVMLAIKHITDYDEKVMICPYDTLNTGSGDVLHKWERLTIRDLIYAAMLSSSNIAANAIARIVGEKILINKKQ